MAAWEAAACHHNVGREPRREASDDESSTATTGGRVSFDMDGSFIGDDDEEEDEEGATGGDSGAMGERVGDVVGAQQGPMASGVRYWHSASFKYPVRP